ncbi:hypothetical protein [Algoriphagus pacificus]|uniref:Uncharacterized protein n=1 Tax=Algoriphagus pacificus TaxID=2811234 RepID=A0ABS3CLS5_9BACT|nr:hypothetical protein [Algoriphagus pacificus]MBN7818048.1 hypothetical protein [Algoriphagus pacificus]
MKLTKEKVGDRDLLIKELIANNSKIASVDDMKKVLFPNEPEPYLISMFHHLNGHRPNLLY